MTKLNTNGTQELANTQNTCIVPNTINSTFSLPSAQELQEEIEFLKKVLKKLAPEEFL